MRVVADASIVAAALIRPRGWTAREMTRRDLELFVPRFLFEELEEHVREFADLAGVRTATFRGRVASLRTVKAVGEEDLLRFLDDPLVRRAEAEDPDDAPYVAAFLAAGADYLWTRDEALLRAFPAFAVRVLPLPE